MGAILHALWLKFGLAASATALGAAVVTAAALPGALHTEVVGLLEPTSATVLVRLGPADFDQAVDRVVLRAGDAVRTDATGRALVTYADGATLVVEPNSEIVIESLEQSGRDVFVLISQTAGRVWYQLSRGMSQTARYEIRSGALAAVVRAGSTVEVAVAADGSTTVTTTEGVAQASAGGSTVAVTTGTSTTVTPSGTPAPLAPSSATPPPSASRPPSAQAPSGSATKPSDADDDDDDEDKETATRQTPARALPMPTLPRSTRTSKESTRRERAGTPKRTPEPVLVGAPMISASGVTVTINVNGRVRTLELTRLPNLTEGRHADGNRGDKAKDDKHTDDDKDDDDKDDGDDKDKDHDDDKDKDDDED